jgi:hypothetical protein
VDPVRTSCCISALAALLLAACGPDELPCVEVSAICNPTFTPTYDQIFTEILEPKCGVEGGACHSQVGAQGGLVLDGNADESYLHLLDVAAERVIPGDPGCSELVIRAEALAEPGVLMPPGNPLSAGERCSIIQWIDMGAPR